MPIFSAGEVRRRWAAVREHSNDLDCVVASSFHNSYYLSGFPMLPWGRFAVTILFRDDPPVLIVPTFERGAAIRESPIDDIRVYGDDEGGSLHCATTLVLSALNERHAKRIGIEGIGTPSGMLMALRDQLPKADFVDATDAIEDVRVISSAEELDYLREGVRISDFGMSKLLDLLKPGLDLSLLTAEVQLAMEREMPPGVQARTICVVQPGTQTLEAHTWLARATSENNTFVETACECYIWGYNGNIERAVLLGNPPADVVRLYETTLEAFSAAIDEVAPGREFAEVDAAARRVFNASGYTNIPVGSGLVRNVGDASGGRIERGNLRPHNHRRLQPGVVVGVEPWVLEPSVGSPRHANSVLVTAAGHEILNQFESGIIRL
jgi:Xaa-Pro dipeptidase